MSWKDLEQTGKQTSEAKKKAKEQAQKEAELSKKFYRVFSSDDGKVVFDHLFRKFVLENDTPLNAQNIEYEAGYHAGEAGAIKYLTHRMSQATQSNEYD